jgi:hypothetical protein
MFRAWQERLRGAMRQWQETQQDEGSLLRGAALAEAEEQLRKRPEELVAESDFIERSLQERERIQQAETVRQKRENSNLRKLLVALLVIWVGSSLFIWHDFNQSIRFAEIIVSSFSPKVSQSDKHLCDGIGTKK